MFLTVTLNPALDKTLTVAEDLPNAIVRATERHTIAGGKGLNTGRALRRLGAPVRALVPVGGHAGAHHAALAAAEGMEVVAVPLAGETRMALTIREEGRRGYRHYLEPGPQWTDDELKRVGEVFLTALEGVHTVLLCGSLPCPAAAPLLPWMAHTAKQRGLRVAVDSFGPHTLATLAEGPWLTKPAAYEWTNVTGNPTDAPEQRWTELERIAELGVEAAVMSLGSAGSFALVNGRRYVIQSPAVEEVNDLGGGDSMVAGMAYAAAQGWSVEEILRWGTACGAANAAVWDPGGISRETVEALLPRVSFTTVVS
jgi:1-phosphofructokinase family hexose kinase